jgi:hypothetical protein
VPNRRVSPRTRRLVAAALVVGLVPSLAGCFNGFGATTTMQNTMNSGNGTQARSGDIRIENATLVTAPETGAATLVMRVVNVGTEEDAVAGVTIGGTPASVTGGTVPVRPGQSVSFGYESTTYANVYAIDTAPSSYVDVVVTMQRAGDIPMQVLTVPPVGYYEGIAPNPPAPPTAP